MSEDSIKFSLSIAEQRAVGFIPAWSLAFLQCTQEQDDSRSPPLSTAQQKAREPSIVERRILGVGLEEWGAVAK